MNNFMNQSPIGVAVVGTGFGQKVHIPGFQAHHRTEVVAVYHRDIDKASSIASAHNIPYYADSLTDIVSRPEVAAVSISTPPFLHYEMAKIALEAGKHLLLEKPTTLSAEEAKELYHLAEAKGVVTAMDFEFRFVPAWQRFQEMLREGYVGNKRLVKIECLVSSRADANRPWNWYAQKEKGGGMLGAMGSHVFDYIRWLFGDIQGLSARLITGIAHRPDPTDGKLKPVDADDTCLLMLELTDRTPVQVCLSSVTYQGKGHWLEVYGDRGTMVLGSSNLKDYVHGFQLLAAPAGESLQEVQIPQGLEFPQTYSDGRIAPFIRVVDAWVESIDTGVPMTPSLPEGMYSQLLMDLAHQSHATNSWVVVPEFL